MVKMWVFYSEMSRQCPMKRKEKRPASLQALFYMVGPVGLEPTTKGL